MWRNTERRVAKELAAHSGCASLAMAMRRRTSSGEVIGTVPSGRPVAGSTQGITSGLVVPAVAEVWVAVIAAEPTAPGDAIQRAPVRRRRHASNGERRPPSRPTDGAGGVLTRERERHAA